VCVWVPASFGRFLFMSFWLKMGMLSVQSSSERTVYGIKGNTKWAKRFWCIFHCYKQRFCSDVHYRSLQFPLIPTYSHLFPWKCQNSTVSSTAHPAAWSLAVVCCVLHQFRLLLLLFSLRQTVLSFFRRCIHFEGVTLTFVVRKACLEWYECDQLHSFNVSISVYMVILSCYSNAMRSSEISNVFTD